MEWWCLSFYTGQSRLGAEAQHFCPQEKEDFVSEKNRPLGATSLKDGSCELWYVVFAFYLISAMAGIDIEDYQSPPNPCGCF